MAINKHIKSYLHTISTFIKGKHRIIIAMVLCLFCLSVAQSKQRKVQKPRKTTEKDSRVYLIHSDVLKYDQYLNPDAQILFGNVQFRHQGATLYCDSAHFYEMTNSFEAFGNVKMYQGDTLSLFSDYAYYDGNDQMAQARYNVVLKHRQTTLYTDSLNYDRMYNIGYFFEGGKMIDKTSTLLSDWGEYDTNTREAVFYFHVDLTDKNFHLTSDTLYYNTEQSMAHAVGPSDIYSGASHIYTEDGYYNTKTSRSQLYGRSTLHNGGKTMTADSIFHEETTGISEAFNNVVYVDSINKNMLTGNYCWYDDPRGYALATDSAVAYDFSQKDTLYVHADTFRIYTYNIQTDSVYRKIHAYHKVRAYRTEMQAVCDSMVYNSQDSCITMYRDPITWNNNQQLLGEVIKVYMKDSTIHRAHVIGQALSVEQNADTAYFNQVASKEMIAYFKDGNVYETDANDNVSVIFYPIDDSDSTMIGMNYTESNQLKMFLEDRKMKKIWMPKAEGVLYPMPQIPAGKQWLPNFAWFDYVRPTSKEDIFHWRGKKAGTELKEVKRKEVPMQRLPQMQQKPQSQPQQEPQPQQSTTETSLSASTTDNENTPAP